jgi:hypothetical protein
MPYALDEPEPPVTSPFTVNAPVYPDSTRTPHRFELFPPTTLALSVTANDPALSVRTPVELETLSVVAIPAVIVTVAAAVTPNAPPAAMTGDALLIFFSEFTVTDWSILTVNPLEYTSSVEPGSVPPSHVAVLDQLPDATAYRIAMRSPYE